MRWHTHIIHADNGLIILTIRVEFPLLSYPISQCPITSLDNHWWIRRDVYSTVPRLVRLGSIQLDAKLLRCCDFVSLATASINTVYSGAQDRSRCPQPA